MVSDTSLHSEVRVSPHADPAEMSSKQLLRPVWFEHSYGMGHMSSFQLPHLEVAAGFVDGHSLGWEME